FGVDAARPRRLLRSPLQHRLHGTGKGRPDQLPERAVRRTLMKLQHRNPMVRGALTSALAVLVAVPFAAQAQDKSISFVACPIVQHTNTVPCWLAEYEGETYFLGIQ